MALSSLKLDVENEYDYYRRIAISYLSDSFKTEKGWIYEYLDLYSGTLSSLEENEFTFSSTTVKDLKVVVFNNDNEALTISNIEGKGYQHNLVARFTQEADYYLVYGNNKVAAPRYDISQFENSISDSLSFLTLGEIQIIEKPEVIKNEPLFENQIWLWLVMVAIIFILGWFSLSMLKK